MEFKHLAAFTAVVRYQSFTKAARALFLTQPSVSAQVSQLEEELQTKLLERTTKSIRLTAAGEELFEYASGILAVREKIYRRCSSGRRVPVCIGASTIPSAYLLPDLLTAYRRRVPDFSFELHQSGSQKVIDGVIESRYDVGFVSLAYQDSAFACVRLWSDRLVFITPPVEKYQELLLSRLDPVLELLREPLIFREQGSGSLQSAERFLAQAGLTENELNIVARVDDTEAIKRMVACGLGIAVISDLAVRKEIAEGRLLAFGGDDPTVQRDIFMIHRRDYGLRAGLRAFLEYLEAKACEQGS